MIMVANALFGIELPIHTMLMFKLLLMDMENSGESDLLTAESMLMFMEVN